MDQLNTLIAVDAADDVEIITNHLARVGITLRSTRVETEAEFSSALASGSWDLVFSDLKLRSFSGFKALDLFKEHGVDIPFIMISNTGGEDSAVDAMKHGASDYLMKGNLTRLGPVVERELRDSAHRRKRRLAEKALKESEEKYKIVAETASDGIITIDHKSKILYVNPATESIFGYSQKEMIGNRITMLIPHKLKLRHLNAVETYLRTSDRQMNWKGAEVPAIKKDGTEILISLSFGEFRSENIHSFTAIVRDITETRRAEAALQQFVWSLDTNGRNIKMPSWWFDLTGQTVEESSDFGWLNPIHPADRETVEKTYRFGGKQKEVVSVNFRIRTVSGEYRHFVGRGVPVFNPTGDFVQWICALIDTTEKVRAEIELRQSEENFRALIQATTQFVWTAKTIGSSEKVFQWFSEILNQPISSIREILKLMKNTDVSEIKAAWVLSLRNKTLFDKVCRFVKDDGSTIYLAVRSVPMFHEDGSFLHWIGTFTDITESMVNQVALETSETQLRTIIESVPECVKLLDLDGKIQKINPAGLDMLGVDSFESVKGMLFADLVTPEFREIFINCTKSVIAGNPGENQFEIVNLKNEKRWLDMRYVPIRDTDRNVISVLCVTRDETERQKSNDALRTSEERFRDLFENANDLIYTHDLDGNFTSLNRSGEIITGYSRDEAAAMNIREVVAPDYLELGLKMLNAKIAGGAPTTYETEIITKNGKRVMLDLSTRMIYENGKPFAIQGVARDITERRQTELAIRLNELQLRVITNTIPVGITYISADGILRFANRALLEWFSKSAGEVIGKHIRDLLGEYSYRLISPEFDIVLSGELFDIERQSFIRQKKNNNEMTQYVRMNYVPEFSSTGEVVAFFAFMTDITESKNAESALRKSEEQLIQSQKLESVGRLAGGIAHDFNNMLTAINGYSELTLRRMHHSDPLRSNIEEIKKAGERSAELTNQLLAFSRRQIMQPRILELNYAISDLIPMLKRLIGEDIQLRTVFSSEKGMINVDPGQFSQVLLNLIVNARDSMPQGGSILIETFLKNVGEADNGLNPGRYSVLAITDTGVGIDSKSLPHIFEPFFTTKEVGKGTGLGLSTVHGIVHQSGGNVNVKSEPGKGSRFEICLPVVTENKTDTFDAQTVIGPSFGTETILLVEDEETVRDLGREVIESCGYTVITAKDGIEALAILKEKGTKIALVLTDVVMPNMGGRELAAEATKLFPHIKVLFSSGYDNKSIANPSALPKGTNFIQKPFTFDALTLKIRELLDQEQIS